MPGGLQVIWCFLSRLNTSMLVLMSWGKREAREGFCYPAPSRWVLSLAASHLSPLFPSQLYAPPVSFPLFPPWPCGAGASDRLILLLPCSPAPVTSTRWEYGCHWEDAGLLLEKGTLGSLASPGPKALKSPRFLAVLAFAGSWRKHSQLQERSSCLWGGCQERGAKQVPKNCYGPSCILGTSQASCPIEVILTTVLELLAAKYCT